MIDEHTLQKLVDGELENDQIRILLRDADQADLTTPTGGDKNSSAWKQMAVAFAENQLIQRSFGDFNSPSGASSPISTETETTIPSNTHPRAITNSGSHTAWAAALAASLLIGTALLYHFASSSKVPVTAPSFAAASAPAASDADAILGDQQEPLLPFDRRTLMALAPDHQLNPEQLPTAFAGKGQPQVPLYDAKRFDRRQLSQLRGDDSAAKRAWFDQVIPTGSVSDQMVADYEKAGMLVDQDIEFLSGRLDDGRSYMIPYRTVRFLPGQ